MPAVRTSEDKKKSAMKKGKDGDKFASIISKGKGKKAVTATTAKPASTTLAKGTKRAREDKAVEPVVVAKKQAKAVEPTKTKASKQQRQQKKATAVVEESSEAASADKEEEENEEAVAPSKAASGGVPFKAAEDSDSDEDEDGEILHGLSDMSDGDSSDEDDENVGEITKSGVVKLPSSRDDVAVKSRLDNVQKKKKESGRSSNPMVLYFGRVPKSMPEESLRAYLSQFGTISRLRLSRNKRTGATKHYAFVEFEDEEVGQIVQETMNNYLLEGRLLQVRVLPKDKVHPSLWVGANKKWRKVPEVRRYRVLHDEPKTQEEKEKVEKKLLKRQDARRLKIQSQGIQYDFQGYA